MLFFKPFVIDYSKLCENRPFTEWVLVILGNSVFTACGKAGRQKTMDVLTCGKNQSEEASKPTCVVKGWRDCLCTCVRLWTRRSGNQNVCETPGRWWPAWGDTGRGAITDCATPIKASNGSACPSARLYWWRIRNLDKEKQTLAAPLSKQQRERRAGR